MPRRRCSRVSPSMMVACAALLVGLTGTSVAAIQLAAPNSVGSQAVIDGSLQRRDFKAGTIPTGKGGQDGPPGPAGPSDAYSVSAPDVGLETDSAPLATLKLPKGGKYVVWATFFYSTTNSAGDAVRCKLTAGDTSDESWTNLGGPGHATMASSVVGVFPAGGSVVLSCLAATNKATAKSIRVTAIRVGNLVAS